MRLLPLMLSLLACQPTEDAKDGPPDPRQDPSGWPETVGGERPAAVVAPTNHDGQSLLPLVVLLHGYGVNAVLQDLVFQLSPRVDRMGFVLLMPDGTEDATGMPFWNATEACCNFYGSEVDDSAYLAGLIDEVEAAWPIDPDRITVVGHSNGGFMSYRMACDHADRLAGIAPLAGGTFRDEADCHASQAISVLHIHGTADPDVSFVDDGWTPGAEASLARWTDRAGCKPQGTNEGRADYDITMDGSETTRTAWRQGCDAGLDFQLWAIEGAGHVPAFSETFRDDLATWLLAQRRR